MKTIMNEENKMLEELGINNTSPFKTPEGYFDTLTQRIMENIPDEDEVQTEDSGTGKTRIVSLFKQNTFSRQFIRWTVAAAACIALVFIGIQVYNKDNDTRLANNEINSDNSEYFDDEYAEELLSYSMMDESDVYNYLSGDEY